MNAREQRERRLLQQKRGDRFCVLCASPEGQEHRPRKPCCPACGGPYAKLLKLRARIGAAEHDRRARIVARAHLQQAVAAAQAKLSPDAKLDAVAGELDRLDAARGPVLVDPQGRPL